MTGGTDLTHRITGETGHTPRTIAVKGAIHTQSHALPTTVDHRLAGDHDMITLPMIGTTGGAGIEATLVAIHQEEGATHEATLPGQGEAPGGATHPGQGGARGGATLAATQRGQGGVRGGVTLAACLEAPGGVSHTLPRSMHGLGLGPMTVALQGATQATVHPLDLGPLQGLLAQGDLLRHLPEVAESDVAW